MADDRFPIRDFHGGLHLDDHKAESTAGPIRVATLPARLVLPLQQHIGLAAEPVVKVGEQVSKGQMIAAPTDYVSAAIHAPTSGTIAAIDQQPIAHPSGLTAPCITLESDGNDTWAELPAALDYQTASAEDIRERLRWAGIVGLGGAVFPANVKLNPGNDFPIDTLIINGAECEPYITCDDMLMRSEPERILDGIRILLSLLDARHCLIGVEDNKPEAIANLRLAIEAAADERIELRIVPTKYPSGGEKQLIQLLTGIEVPSQGLPAEIGVLVHNVGTVAKIADAVLHGRPLIDRIVTITGSGVQTPCNLRALIGTPVNELIAQAGGYSADARRLVMGGPMMGFTLRDDRVPMTKGSNCFLVTAAADTPQAKKARPCIRCGECVDVCPARLLPQQLYWFARARDLDKAQDHHLFDCIECGCCAHVCPSHIPLVQYYRFAKTEIWAAERERQKADQARQRHEAREARLQRLEEERKARLRQKKEALEKKAAGAADPKKAAIEAAMKRVAAKKAAQQPEKEN